MKGCLKQPSRSSTPTLDGEPCQHKKCVAFGSIVAEEVHIADEWDRTPTEPARKLSYQDLLELKEIQRSLPHANQPDDRIAGRPARHYLSGVPITLLPLLAETPSSSDSSQTSSLAPSPRSASPTLASAPASLSSSGFPFPYTPPPSASTPPTRVTSCYTTTPSSPSTVSPWAINFQRRKPPPPVAPAAAYASSYRAPSSLAHLLPSRPAPQRPKPSFAFLPLLDAPPDAPLPLPPHERTPSPPPESDAELASDTDQSSVGPPTPSLTNASLDSSPHSRASSCSPEPTHLQLPPPRQKGAGIGAHDSYFPPQEYCPPAPMKLQALHSPVGLLPPSPLILEGSAAVAAPKPKPAKKRNFILVNDMEIELDDDDEEDDDEEVVVVQETKADTDLLKLEKPAQRSVPTVEDTALSETKTTIASSSSSSSLALTPSPSSTNLVGHADPVRKLENAWSDPRPTTLSSSTFSATAPPPEPPTTPTPTRHTPLPILSSTSTTSTSTCLTCSPPRTPCSPSTPSFLPSSPSSPSKPPKHASYSHSYGHGQTPRHSPPRQAQHTWVLARTLSRSPPPPASTPPNLHMPVLFKRAAPRDREARTLGAA